MCINHLINTLHTLLVLHTVYYKNSQYLQLDGMLQELLDHDMAVIEEAHKMDPANAEFQQLLQEHIDCTDFLRQQKQSTLLHHQQMLKQKLKERLKVR